MATREKGMSRDMISGVMLWTVIMMLSGYALCRAQQVPHGIAGLVLGEDISRYEKLVDMSTDLPIRHMEYIREVEIRDMEGFKSGLIHYGTCAQPGKIVRIKLKYADSSRQFYEKLLERYKQRFGEPSEWIGDVFHIVVAWKWSFVDEHQNRISLVLQHNTKDVEEKLGNSVKIALTNVIEKEHDCFESKQPKTPAATQMPHRPGREGGPLWERWIPR